MFLFASSSRNFSSREIRDTCLNHSFLKIQKRSILITTAQSIALPNLPFKQHLNPLHPPRLPTSFPPLTISPRVKLNNRLTNRLHRPATSYRHRARVDWQQRQFFVHACRRCPGLRVRVGAFCGHQERLQSCGGYCAWCLWN